MSLKTKLFIFLVATPILLIGYFLFLLSSTFVATQTAGIYENQLQLLNSVHLLLSKIDSRDLALSTKNIFDQEGLHSLMITDSTGKIRYAGNAKLVGKSISETLGEKIQTNIREQTFEEGSFEATGAQNEKLLISFFKFELADNRYFMLLSKPKAIATRAALLFIYKCIGAVIALLAAFFFFSRMIYRSLTQGLVQISSAMGALGQGNWVSQVPLAGDGEIGELAKSFRSMRKQLQNFLQEDQKKTRIAAQDDFSGGIRDMFLSSNELRIGNLHFAAALESNRSGGTFWHHCQKTTVKGSHLLFLLAEAPRGEALATLSAICRWALEKDPAMTDTQSCVQILNSLIAATFGKSVSWNYCLCSLNLNSGELDWVTLSYTTPTPIILNAGSQDSQAGSEGRIILKKGDFVILHSSSTKPKFPPDSATLEKIAANELLQILNSELTPQENFNDQITTNSIDQSCIVVKWENSIWKK